MFGCQEVSYGDVEAGERADKTRKGRVYIVCSKNPKHKQVSRAFTSVRTVTDKAASRIGDVAE
jgi:hypothetical protein